MIANWDSVGCDLWEEVQSDDFFWNRMGYVYSLNNAASLAQWIGQDPTKYWSTANHIKDELRLHYNGNYLWESENREIDGAVIHAVTTFGSDLFGPLSPWTAKTI